MKPELVVEVKFTEWTEDEIVRQAVFMECVNKTVGGGDGKRNARQSACE